MSCNIWERETLFCLITSPYRPRTSLEMISNVALKNDDLKNDDLKNFHITTFPFLCSNISSLQAYGMLISQLIRYARACSSYECFILRARRLSSKLLKQGYLAERLISSFRKFYGRYGDLINPLPFIWVISGHFVVLASHCYFKRC